MDLSFTAVAAFTGVIALVWLCVFVLQYREGHDVYVGKWRIVWGAYFARCLALLLADRWNGDGALDWVARFAFVCVAWALVRSSQSARDRSLRRPDWIFLAAGALWSTLDLWNAPHGSYRAWELGPWRLPYVSSSFGVAIAFAFAAVRFYRLGARRHSRGKQWMAASLALWSAMLIALQIMLTATQSGYPVPLAFLNLLLAASPLPNILLGISMLSVLFERDRRTIQENLLAFATLNVDRTRLLTLKSPFPHFAGDFT